MVTVEALVINTLTNCEYILLRIFAWIADWYIGFNIIPCFRECCVALSRVYVLPMENFTRTENTSFNSLEQLHFHDFSNVPDWARTFVLVYLTAIMSVGVPGNALLILVQVKNKHKTSTDYLILTMAVYDFFSSLLTVPMNIFRNTKSVWKYVASAFFCKLLGFATYQMTMASVFLLSATAIDRYIKTHHPLNRLFTAGRAKLTCAVISLTCVLLRSPPLLVYGIDSRLNCEENKQWIEIMEVYRMFLAIITVFGFFIKLICYVKVGIVIKRRHSQRAITKLVLVKGQPGDPTAVSSKSGFKDKTTKRNQVGSDFPRCMTDIEILPTTSRLTNMTYASSQPIQSLPGTTSSQKPTQSRNAPSSLEIASHDSRTYLVTKETLQPPKPKVFGMSSPATGVVDRLREEEKLVNKTTLMLFLITFVYVLTLFVQWLLILSHSSVFGTVGRYFSMTLNLVNCITNPVVMFGIHARYRAQVKSIFRGH